MARQAVVDGDDVHAHRAETSVMLVVAPHLVHLGRSGAADDQDRTEGLVFPYTVPTLYTNGVTGRPSEPTRELGDTYLTAAVMLDRGMAPGTGTPEPGGLTSRQLLDAVRRCAIELPLCGADIVELAPDYDGPGQVTAFLANRIVLEILSGIAKRRRSS